MADWSDVSVTFMFGASFRGSFQLLHRVTVVPKLNPNPITFTHLRGRGTEAEPKAQGNQADLHPSQLKVHKPTTGRCWYPATDSTFSFLIQIKSRIKPTVIKIYWLIIDQSFGHFGVKHPIQSPGREDAQTTKCSSFCCPSVLELFGCLIQFICFLGEWL